MSRPATVTATIELRLGAPSPDGVLTDAAGRARRFVGWIELGAVLEDWRVDATTGDGAGPDITERTGGTA